MLRFRYTAAIALITSLSILSSACGGGRLDCIGSWQPASSANAAAGQYGNVTCVTSTLDKEATDGGE